MGEVHDLLEQHGKQGVLRLDIDRRVVEAAADYLSDEDGGLGFIYSGWAIVSRCWSSPAVRRSQMEA
jgi:hypothetical protein